MVNRDVLQATQAKLPAQTLPYCQRE